MFFRSHGQRGANVEFLRGNTGADFEGEAKVYRGDGAVGLFECACLGWGNEPVRDAMKEMMTPKSIV